MKEVIEFEDWCHQHGINYMTGKYKVGNDSKLDKWDHGVTNILESHNSMLNKLREKEEKTCWTERLILLIIKVNYRRLQKRYI